MDRNRLSRPSRSPRSLLKSRLGRLGALTFALLALTAGVAAFAQEEQPDPNADPSATSGEPPKGEPTKAQQLLSDSWAFSVPSPYSDLPRAIKFLQKLGTSLVLGLDYSEEAANSEIGGNVSSLESKFYYGKRTGSSRRRLLFGLAVSPSGGYDLYVAGVEITGSGRKANPELNALRDPLAAMIDQEKLAVRASSLDNLGQEILQLSHSTTDRVIANLKTLGYSTVEYQGLNAENVNDKIFKPVENGDRSRLPLVVKLVDSFKTSLLDAAPVSANSAGGFGGGFDNSFGGGGGGGGFGGDGSGSGGPSALTNLGGTYLHQATAGDPQQRLLIIYDPRSPEGMERLVNLIHDKLDVPARQIVIDAQVIEVSGGYTTDIGVEWFGGTGKLAGGLQQNSGLQDAFTLSYGSALADVVGNFTARIQALESSGEVEILSNPSVLVLDGRQARIQVGKQVPLQRSFATAASTSTDTTYIPVGIVLNIKPRVTDEGRAVTMQVETIVSEVSASNVPTAAPTLDNRQVQTFVRVADNTPFIIGGLMSENTKEQRYGVPFLQRIPILGWLFRNGRYQGGRREVIIVITPHVVPLSTEPTFSYVLPKGSDIFNNFGSQLFRNSYRLRAGDIYDLKFVTSSEVLHALRDRIEKRAKAYPEMRRKEPFAGILHGEVPGEEILVKRMLWDVVERSPYLQGVQLDKMLFFEEDPKEGSVKPQRLRTRIKDIPSGKNILSLSYEAQPRATLDRPFAQPKALVAGESIKDSEYSALLAALNRRKPDGTPIQWSILLRDGSVGKNNPLEQLRNVLVLKRLLLVNPTMPLTIKDFKAGRQLTIPSRTDLEQTFHIVDTDAARSFYEVTQVYQAFDREFKYRSAQILKQLDEQWPEPGEK